VPGSYIIGAAFITNYYVTLGSPPDGVVLGSSQWVGAWWLGFLVPGIVLLIFGIPVILFPEQMPAAKVRKLALS